MSRPSRSLAARRARAVQPRLDADRRARAASFTGIRQADTVGASSQTVANHRPRNTWHQRGWTDVSPYYRTAITVDRRWDK